MTNFLRPKPTAWQNFCQRLVLKRTSRIRRGSLWINLPDGERIHYGDPDSEEKAEISIGDFDFFSRIVLGGDVGLGEAYVDGLWDSPDVVRLFELLIINRDLIGDGSFFLTVLQRTGDRVRHLLRDNSLSGSKRNIQEHYDLGNDFYETFLDSSMTYSCAVYRSPDEPLELAQKNKKRDIIERLQLTPEHHLLEIGCGWGAFAIEVAKQTGCRVTGITLSEEQRAWAVELVKKEGLQDRIDIQLTDYRHVEGTFDRIVSIEMLEAVGHRWLEKYFCQCDKLLKPGGIMAIQTITIPCTMYDYHRNGTDWIRKHIFPGGNLPSLTAILNSITGTTSLAVHEMREIGHYYADTLREWRKRFKSRLSCVESYGLCEKFQRKWDYYLATCESGFATRATGTMQLFLSKKDS